MVINKHIKMPIVALFTLLSALVSSSVFATTVVATVSKNKVVQNEVFQLRIVADKKVSSDALDLTSLEQDFYLGRPSFGSSINIINGDRSTRSEWNVTLAAQRLGVATIPAFTIDGASSQPIKVQVSVDNDMPKVSDLVEVQNSLSNDQLYPNESTQLTTRLIIKAAPHRLQNPNIVAPKADGLSIEAIGEPKQYQSAINGMEVTVVDQSYRVTAEQAGDYLLNGVGFQGSVVYADNRSGATKLISADTPAKQFTVTVAPIPQQLKGHWLPATSLQLNQRWLDSNGNPIDTTKPYATRVGESLTREITLDIEGLATERFPQLKIDYPDSVRVYPQKPQFSALSGGQSRMTVKQVIIAQQQGEVALNDIKLNWWDSRNQQEKVSSLAGLELKVKPALAINNEPIETPTLTEPATVTVYQAGIWPYLTTFFALLWLATLLLWLKKTRGVKPEQTKPEYPISQQLLAALKEDDKVKASFLAQTWLNEHTHLDSKLKQKIEQQLNEMNVSQYSSAPQNWQAQTLIDLIKRAEKLNSSNQTNSDKLPQL